MDAVITYVNGLDPVWQQSYNQYIGAPAVTKHFRDWGTLKYLLRGIETHLPFIRNVYLVVSGESQIPDWADRQQLHIVLHEDIIPHEFLPVFNSTAIEMFLHRIAGLDEEVLYFNDDFFIIRPVSKERFFKNGLPCDFACFQYNPSWSQWYKTLKNNIKIINRHFDKREVLEKFHDKWYNPLYRKKAKWNYRLKNYNKFITLRTHHNAQPYLKSTFPKVWEAAGKELTATSSNRFRNRTDYSPELFRTWQICEGNFEPYNTYCDTKMFPLMVRPKQAVKAIYNQEYTLVCLNDNVHIRHYDRLMEEIDSAFNHILPLKSSFEL